MYQKKIEDEYVDGFIRFHPDTGKCAVLKQEDGVNKRLVMKEIPEWLSPTNYPSDKVNVAYQSGKLKKVKPIAGNFRVQFVGFAAKEGETPAPKEGIAFKKPALFAYALFEMLDDGWKGNTISIKLEYSRLERDEDTGNAFVSGTSKAANLLISLLIGLGFNINNPIKFSANMLPEIEKRAKSERILTVDFSKGWAQTFEFEEEVPGNFWDEEEPVAEAVITGEVPAGDLNSVSAVIPAPADDPDGWGDDPSDENEDEGWGEAPADELEGMA